MPNGSSLINNFSDDMFKVWVKFKVLLGDPKNGTHKSAWVLKFSNTVLWLGNCLSPPMRWASLSTNQKFLFALTFNFDWHIKKISGAERTLLVFSQFWTGFWFLKILDSESADWLEFNDIFCFKNTLNEKKTAFFTAKRQFLILLHVNRRNFTFRAWHLENGWLFQKHPWIQIWWSYSSIKLAKTLDEIVKKWKNGKKSQFCSKSAICNFLNFCFRNFRKILL